MRDYISSLVQQTLQEYLNKKDAKPHLLILLEHHRLQPAEMLEQLLALSNQFHLTFLLSEGDQERFSALQFHDVMYLERVQTEDMEQLVQSMDLLYCPGISHGFLAKLSLLLDDTPAVWVTLQMLLSGKNVLLGTDVIQRKRGINFWQRPTMDRKVQSYMKELKKDGVHFCAVDKASKMIVKHMQTNHDRKPLLLAKHIEDMANAGHQTMTVPVDCLITPMAKDAARELQVTIKEEARDDR